MALSAFFLFMILSLASFRLTRLVTLDSWPPAEWFRDRVEQRTGADSGWTTLFTCPWCFSVWVAAAVFLEQYYLRAVPSIVYTFLAGAAVVGLLAEWSSE